MNIKLIVILFFVFVYIQCTPSDPFINSYLLEDQWILEEVVAPDFPFPSDLETNPISLAFPKTEEYELFLKQQSCSGTYLARQNGEIEFKRTNCSISCCDSEWDHYFITIMKKSTFFVAKEKQSLKLIINEDNYILFKHEQNTLSP